MRKKKSEQRAESQREKKEEMEEYENAKVEGEISRRSKQTNLSRQNRTEGDRREEHYKEAKRREPKGERNWNIQEGDVISSCPSVNNRFSLLGFCPHFSFSVFSLFLFFAPAGDCSLL